MVPTLVGERGGYGMERLRIGVIGLGWFGEIHCETIVGVPNLELAALCTRTPERLAALAEKFGVSQDLSRLSRPAGRSRDRRRVDRDDVGPAHRARGRGARSRQARLPRKADRLDRRRLRRRSSPRRRRAQGHLFSRPHLPLQSALPHGQAGDRRRARSAGSSRSARAATSPPRGRRTSSTRSARSSATPSTTPT